MQKEINFYQEMASEHRLQEYSGGTVPLYNIHVYFRFYCDICEFSSSEKGNLKKHRINTHERHLSSISESSLGDISTTQDVINNMTAGAEPVLSAVSEPVFSVITKPVLSAVSEPVFSAVSEPVLSTVSEPIMSAFSEPVLSVVTEPVTVGGFISLNLTNNTPIPQ